MTKKETKELLPIMQAWVEGKTIQYFNISENKWCDIPSDVDNVAFTNEPCDYRIKPNLTYKPFKNQKECWDEMLNHKPFGWIRDNNTQCLYNISSIGRNSYGVVVNNSIMYFDLAFNTCNFVDGTPFGIQEEL